MLKTLQQLGQLLMLLSELEEYTMVTFCENAGAKASRDATSEALIMNFLSIKVRFK